MKEVSKVILGQWRNERLYFSDHEKKLIIEDYLSGNETKLKVYHRYTGYPAENGKITMWMRKFGVEDKYVKNTICKSMPKQKNVKDQDDFETLTLKKRIAELEKQLQTAEMKAVAFSTMVDIAEKEFNIPIRKKHNTKL
jgi:transposase